MPAADIAAAIAGIQSSGGSGGGSSGSSGSGGAPSTKVSGFTDFSIFGSIAAGVQSMPNIPYYSSLKYLFDNGVITINTNGLPQMPTYLNPATMTTASFARVYLNYLFNGYSPEQIQVVLPDTTKATASKTIGDIKGYLQDIFIHGGWEAY